MIDTLWIHIGMGKTGTSALQAYFAGQDAKIEQDQGVRYLQSGRINRAHQLLAPTYQRGKNDQWRRCLRELEQELLVHACPSGLISSEFLCWTNIAYCRLLRARIPSPNVRIVFFVREIGDLLYATFLQRIKSRPGELASLQFQFEPFLEKLGTRMDFTARLAPWMETFGQEALRIVDYDRMGDIDSTAELCKLLGISHRQSDIHSKGTNGSLNEDDLALLRFMDRECQLPPIQRKALIGFLASRRCRTKTSLPVQFRKQVESLYAELDRKFREEHRLQPRVIH